MGNWKENKYIKISLCAFGVIAASLVLVVFVLHLDKVYNGVVFFLDVISPFIWGFCFAYILNYPYRLLLNLLTQKTKKGRQMPQKAAKIISIVLAYVFFLSIMTLFFYLVVPQIVTAVARFMEDLPSYLKELADNAEHFAVKYLHRYGVSVEDVTAIASDVGKQMTADFDINQMVTRAATVIVSASAGIKNAFLGLIVSIYFLWDKERFARSFKRLAYALFPKNYGDKLIDVMRFTDKTFGGFLIAKIVDSAIIGVLNYIFMAIMGMEYAILISVIVGVTNIIPFFGPFIGGIPSVLLMLTVNPWNALLLGIFLVVLQQFDGNFLGPKLMGDTMGIRAVFVVFAVIVFGGLFGIVGMFIGVPMFVVLYTLFAQAITERLKKKEIQIK